jgi:hypothetical protein
MMPQAPMRCRLTSRSMTSRSAGTVGSRWARSPGAAAAMFGGPPTR